MLVSKILEVSSNLIRSLRYDTLNVVMKKLEQILMLTKIVICFIEAFGLKMVMVGCSKSTFEGCNEIDLPQIGRGTSCQCKRSLCNRSFQLVAAKIISYSAVIADMFLIANLFLLI